MAEADLTAGEANLLKEMAVNAPIANAGMKLILNAIEHDRLPQQEAKIHELTGRAQQ